MLSLFFSFFHFICNPVSLIKDTCICMDLEPSWYHHGPTKGHKTHFSFFRSYQLSLAPQVRKDFCVPRHLCWDANALTLCRSCTRNHSCCEFINAMVLCFKNKKQKTKNIVLACFFLISGSFSILPTSYIIFPER